MLRTHTHTHHLQFKRTKKHKQLGGSFSTLGCCFATLMKLTTNFRSPHDQLADFSTLNERLGNGYFTYTPRHVKTMKCNSWFLSLNYCDGNIDAHSRRHKHKRETLYDSVDDVYWESCLRMRICLCVQHLKCESVALKKKNSWLQATRERKRPLSTATSSVAMSL
jgi:hypothetical protein